MDKDNPGLKARQCVTSGGVSTPSQNKGLNHPVLKGRVSSVITANHSSGDFRPIALFSSSITPQKSHHPLASHQMSLPPSHEQLPTEPNGRKKFSPFLFSNTQPAGIHYEDYEYPKVSIIIPSFESSERISFTLKNILQQHYPDFEIILVDARSTDTTFDVIRQFRDPRIRCFTGSSQDPFYLINQGLTQAKGTYINILFPGEGYLHTLALENVMRLALDKGKPALILSTALPRPEDKDPKVYLAPFTQDLVSRGIEPTTLESCWIHQETINLIGTFDVSLSERATLDFFCRIILRSYLRVAVVKRVLVLSNPCQRKPCPLHCLLDTVKILRHYFGFGVMLKWLFFEWPKACSIKEKRDSS